MPPERQAASSTALLPIMAAVFMAFAVIGLAIPVLPLHVHQGLGLGTSLVGLVAGSQFAAAILSRVWAGRDADIRGAKHAVIAGLFIAAAAGVLYCVSLSFVAIPAISVAILLFGRGLLGGTNHCKFLSSHPRVPDDGRDRAVDGGCQEVQPLQPPGRDYDPDRLSPRLAGVRVVRSAMVAS
jgi:hypothetical protein